MMNAMTAFEQEALRLAALSRPERAPAIAKAITEATKALREENEQLKAERDEAIAHDRQPYPTAEAYERVCTARTAWQKRADAAESANKALVEALRETDIFAREMWIIFSNPNFTDRHDDAGRCERIRARIGAALAAHEEHSKAEGLQKIGVQRDSQDGSGETEEP